MFCAHRTQKAIALFGGILLGASPKYVFTFPSGRTTSFNKLFPWTLRLKVVLFENRLTLRGVRRRATTNDRIKGLILIIEFVPSPPLSMVTGQMRPRPQSTIEPECDARCKMENKSSGNEFSCKLNATAERLHLKLHRFTDSQRGCHAESLHEHNNIFSSFFRKIILRILWQQPP